MSTSCYIDPENLETGQLRNLWQKQLNNGWDANHHHWIRAVRAKLNQETTYELPDSFNDKNTAGLTITLPQTVITSLRTVSMLERRRPKVKRKKQGITPREQSIATDTTTWLNAVLEAEQQGRKMLDWGKLIGKLFLEGAAAIVAVPSPADFEKCPEYIDTIDARRYEKMSKARQANYKQNDEGRYEQIDEDGMPSPASRYWRDADGRASDDKFYTSPLERDHKKHGKKGTVPTFSEDRSQTKKAYAEMREHYLASRLPFKVRILSPTDAIPIFGPGEQLYGLIECAEYTEEELLRRNYIIGPPITDEEGKKVEGQPALVQGVEGKGNIRLFSYWGLDKHDHPFVAYEAEGRTYTKFGDPDDEENQETAVVNLYDELGIERLPVRWCWGLHLETEEVSKKGVPYLRPILDTITMAERFLTMKAVHADQHAFPSYVIEPDPEILRTNPGIFFHSDGSPRIIPLTPMHMVVAPGKITPLVTPMVGNDVNDLIKILMGAASSMGPSASAFGGDGATSGFDRALTKEYLETSMWQVMSGGLEGYGWAGSFILEHGARLAEYYEIDLPVYAEVENKQSNVKPANETDEPTQQIVCLKSDWVGPIYDVTPYYDREFGENFALAQQMSQDVKDGLATFDEYREKVYGDQYPHITRIKIWFDQWLRTDEGRGRIAELAGEMIGTGLEDELKELIRSGEMTDDGVPLAALPDGWQGQIEMEMPPPGMPMPISPLPPGMPGPVGPAPGPGESGPQRTGTLPPTMLQSMAGGMQSGATMGRELAKVAEATQGIQPV
jgi:hypothetical protein